MSRSIFGWRRYDVECSAMGTERPCETCGLGTSSCICPECEVCGEAGNPYCYDQGHLHYSLNQLIGLSKLRIYTLQQQLVDEQYALLSLENQKREDNCGPQT